MIHAAPSERSERLKSLLVRCWRPVFAFIRNGWATTKEDALDLTQEFILHMLEGDALKRYERERSRFRRFVKACLHHFLLRERRDANRERRGGGRRPISLEGLSEANCTLLPPSPDGDPEASFDREWAASLLSESSDRLREELAKEGKERLFDVWKLCVLDRPSGEERTYKEAGASLGMTEAAVRETLHRLRRRYREILVDRISDGVTSADDLFAELKELFSNDRGPLP